MRGITEHVSRDGVVERETGSGASFARYSLQSSSQGSWSLVYLAPYSDCPSAYEPMAMEFSIRWSSSLASMKSCRIL